MYAFKNEIEFLTMRFVCNNEAPGLLNCAHTTGCVLHGGFTLCCHHRKSVKLPGVVATSALTYSTGKQFYLSYCGARCMRHVKTVEWACDVASVGELLAAEAVS